jgi:ABC-2 type transport system ATP-binding protein
LTAISAKGLSKYYGTVKALDNLNLEIPENAVFGFLGPNGAGKTTTIKLLTGFANPTAGEAWVAGEKIGDNSLGVQAKIGLVPDVPAFYEWMTGRDLLHFIGELHALPQDEIKKRTEELLELVELKKHGNRRVGGYSRGMRQRLGIAQALINHPKVLFLDEPTSALDPIGRRELLNLIIKLRENTTVFMSSHILSDVERVCNMVGIVNKGKLVTVDSVEGLQKKYARSIFEIEFMEDAMPFVESLKKINWLADAALVIDNGTPRITVRAIDVERARKELPRLISDSGLTMTRYELTLPSVEDIFVEIMTNGDKK